MARGIGGTTEGERRGSTEDERAGEGGEAVAGVVVVDIWQSPPLLWWRRRGVW